MDIDNGSREFPALHEDIIDDIFSHLPDAKRTLANCCLVARAWLVPGRRHLFRKIAIRGNKVKSHMPAFVEFLQTSQYASTCVRELTLDSNVSSITTPIHLGVATILTILNTMSHLHRLSIVDTPLFDDTNSPSLLPAARSAASLDYLAVSGTTAYTEAQYVALLAVVCGCARIGTLDLGIYMLVPRPDSPVNMYMPTPRPDPQLGSLIQQANLTTGPIIHSLVFQLPYHLPLLPLYRTLAPSGLSLTSLSFHGLRITGQFGDADPQLRTRASEFCDHVIDATQKTLRELEFHPGISVFEQSRLAPEGIWKLPDLSRHTRLKALTLPLDCDDMPYAGSELTNMAKSHAYILRMHSPPSLERLIFKARVPYQQDTLRYQQQYVRHLLTEFYRPSWDELDEALSTIPTCPQVVVEFIGPWQGIAIAEPLEQAMRELLPDTSGKGMLRVSLEKSFPRWRF